VSMPAAVAAVSMPVVIVIVVVEHRHCGVLSARG
jgi:hypothetical protein